MKNYTFMIFITIAILIMTGSPSLAQIDGAANTSKEGSLLIWPLVQTNNGNETYIFINNNASSDVLVKCFWEVKDVPTDPASECLFFDFTVQIPAYRPLIFRASDGSSLDDEGVAAGMGSSQQGSLKCWAVEETMRKQISWNHLSGFAIIVQGDSTLQSVAATSTTSAWQYSAWRFAANIIVGSGAYADGFWVGEVVDEGEASNMLALKASPTTVVTAANCPAPYNVHGCYMGNAAYDACPKYVTFDFLSEPSGAAKTDGYAFNTLGVVPCKTDLTGTTLSTETQIAYTIWNENGVGYSGLNQCANCAYTANLGSLYVLKNQKLFQTKTLRTPSGHFRIEGEAGSACGLAVMSGPSVDTPLLAAMSSKLVTSKNLVGMGATFSGKETSDWGYVLWYPTGPYYQAVMGRQRGVSR
jgi:hypothetical protein